jgi:hypothetical protein
LGALERFYADVLGVELIDLSVYFRDLDGPLELISYTSQAHEFR